MNKDIFKPLTKEELLKKYRKYEIKTIKDFEDKYVTI